MISPKKAIWLRTSGSFHACPTRMRRSIAAASPNVGSKLGRTTLIQCALIAQRYSQYLKKYYEKIKNRRGTGKGNRCPSEKVFGNHLSDTQEQLGLRRLSQFCTG